ncbi:MAG: U32 family peptidase [Syntrophomonadaceae bacterium]|nr:U32 family peptidase [Syntrophomonadaceae bacterium]
MEYSQIELLAPAGRWEAMEKVAAAGADAVYLGGKRFNMRLLRPGFNFSDQELRDAVDYLHQQDKRLYLTINNLYYDEEIEELSDYLLFLEELGVDALIIQDSAIIKLHQQLGLTVPLHASVQIGLGSSEAVRFFAGHGISRVILSKNLSLQEIAQIHQETGIDIEYFAHGDLCISHTGQCVMSNIIASKSGNRGVCIKPCRWQYTLEGIDGAGNEPGYYLAHKDLCLYSHLQALIEAGVSSFKIEGRMREGDFLAFLVEIYRKALDGIMANQEDVLPDPEDAKKLYENRIRNFTTANLYGRTKTNMVDLSGEREPFFPTAPSPLERLLERSQGEDYTDFADSKPTTVPVELTVKVAHLDALTSLIDAGENRFILGYEYIRQHNAGWNKKQIAKVLEQGINEDATIIIETPRIVCGDEISDIEKLLDWMKAQNLTEVLVNDYGSLRLALDKGFSVSGGPGLNLSNGVAAAFLADSGLKRITASLELNFSRLQKIMQSGQPLEMLIHGPLCGMISDFCSAYDITAGSEEVPCTNQCQGQDYALVDEHGQRYPITTDARCRNYIYYPYHLGLFPYLPQLYTAGLRYLRLDGQYYDTEQLLSTVALYRKAINDLQAGSWQQQDNYLKLLQLHPQGLTARPYFGNSEE